MPQLSQIGEIYASQLFWLLIVFAIIYFGIGRGMVTKIEATVDQRNARISQDLATAEAARKAADATEEAYRARMDAVRGEALKAMTDAKASAARAAEERVKAADAELERKTDEAQQRLVAAQNDALRSIEDVAAEAAQDVVARVSGMTVDRDAAARAVRAVLHG